MNKHIYFVRHGRTDANTDQVYRGVEEALTEEGRAQAAVVAERIKRVGVDTVIGSTFGRAQDTAAIIAEAVGLVPETSEHFVEWLEPSSLLGLHVEDPLRAEARTKILTADDPHLRHEDEETFAELVARAKEGIAFLARHPGERLCVVTHGAFLKVLVGVFVFEDAFTKRIFRQMYRRMPTTNTGITEIRWNEERAAWQLATWNDRAHLG